MRRPTRQHLPHGQGFDEYWRGEMRQLRRLARSAGTSRSPTRRSSSTDDASACVCRRRPRCPSSTAAQRSRNSRASSTSPSSRRTCRWNRRSRGFPRHPAHLPKERRQALAMIAAMDEGIGRIRAKLHERWAWRRTRSSSSSATTARRSSKARGTARSICRSSAKRACSPMAACARRSSPPGPARCPPGKVYEPPVINLDVAATAVALAGLPPDRKARRREPHAVPHRREDGPRTTRSSGAGARRPPCWSFHWKLILLGSSEQFLFDVDHARGRNEEPPRRARRHRAAAGCQVEDLERRTQPPGLPTEINPQDAQFFAEHIDPRFAAAAPKKAKEDPTAVQAGSAATARFPKRIARSSLRRCHRQSAPFLTISPVDFLGPATLTLKVRSDAGGTGGVLSHPPRN